MAYSSSVLSVRKDCPDEFSRSRIDGEGIEPSLPSSKPGVFAVTPPVAMPTVGVEPTASSL